MNKFEKRSKEAYNKIADGYDDSPEGMYTLKFKNLLLGTVKIKDNDNVLDIACGNGRLLKMLSDKYIFNGYGVDISDKMIEQAKTLNPSMKFSVGNCEQLPFADGTFNIITVCAAYHHFPDVNNFAEEAFRLLKPNGQICIADVYYPAIVRAICNPFISLSKAGDVKFYSPYEIMKTLKRVGFQNGNYTTNGYIQIVNAHR